MSIYPVVTASRHSPFARRRPRSWVIASQLLHERPPRVPVGGERFGLPAGAIQRQHELGAQPLTQRVFRGQLAQLANEVAVAAQVQFEVDAVLQDREPPLVEACRRDLHDPAVHPGRRWTLPKRQPGAQITSGVLDAVFRGRRPAAHGEPLEAPDIQVVVGDAEDVPGRACDDGAGDARGGQDTAQSRDADLHLTPGGRGRPIVPEGGDEPRYRDDVVRLQEQHGENDLLTRPPDANDRPSAMTSKGPSSRYSIRLSRSAGGHRRTPLTLDPAAGGRSRGPPGRRAVRFGDGLRIERVRRRFRTGRTLA